MSEKKKPSSATATVDDRAPESDRQFLERTGINDHMKDVLSKMIGNRPEDPIAFLAEYFEYLECNQSPVIRAHQQLCLTHYTRPAFTANLRTAYDILQQSRVGRNRKGVNGKVFMELLQTMCQHFPMIISTKILSKLHCREFEAVTYETFRNGIWACLLLEDYTKQTEDLYNCLDLHHTEKADKCLCDTALHHLQVAVTSSPSNLQLIFDAGTSLAPDMIYKALNKAVASDRNSQQFMTKEEFVNTAAEAFLNKVPEFK